MPLYIGVRKATLTSCSCQSLQDAAGIIFNVLGTSGIMGFFLSTLCPNPGCVCSKKESC